MIRRSARTARFRSQIDGATAPGTSWKIVEAIKKGKKLEGSIKGKAGFRVAVIKKGSKWQFGIAFPGAGGRSFGPVTRSDAKAECATL